jgi:tRNA dimethylallyltransferase
LRALIEGLSEAPTRSEELREKLRESAARRGPEYLHRLLARVDRAAAARIAPRDTQKIIRAIEMRMVSGKPVSEIHSSGRNALQGFEVKKIGLAPAREALYARIDARVHAMVRTGWVEEVRGLVARGVPAEAKPFQFIGYTQLREHIEARMGLEEATAAIQQATRRFAKRQMTWFRREKDVHWLEGCGDEPKVITAATQWAAAEFPELASRTRR